REVLITVMRKHQRYFAVEGQDGKLMPYFIAVRNGDAEHLDIVIDGNEHVLRARFADAAFFYTTDRQKALHDFLPRLSTLTFQEKLGSMLDKNERVASMIDGMGTLLGTGDTDVAIAQRAAHIAKADLATQMVVELTSLQGVMGKVYAGLSGYPQEVADAVFEHWLPRGADDILPQSAAGVLLALTDKLDSLVGLFGVGLAPKSSADPYGLRRAALGVIQILVDQNIDLPLRRAVDLVAASQPVSVSDEAREQVVTFIAGRLEAWLLEQGTAQTDVIQAVLAQQSGNPARAVVGVRELSEWVKRSDWEAVLDSFARCVRITRPVAQHYEVNPTALVEPQEKALYESYQKASGQLNASGNVDAFLSAFTPMLPAVTAFFDNVLVNAEDEQVKRNRLGLLQAIGAMAHGRADLSNLSGF
ncbi:MAG: glycine--tRNA ligase subunit beta, partial [Burkholderiales bacterium]|nr:glycine--tRNA ligase subunit beta [Anaerolineae bacterium]